MYIRVVQTFTGPLRLLTLAFYAKKERWRSASICLFSKDAASRQTHGGKL